MRVGGKGRVRGPGEACAAGCAGQGAVARAAGANCGRRSRVGDRRPCDAGWDGSEDKEKRVRSAGKKKWNDDWNRTAEKKI